MPISEVQTSTGSATSGTTVTASLSAVGAGNAVVIGVTNFLFNNGVPTVTAASCGGTALVECGTIFTAGTGSGFTDSVLCDIWYKTGLSGGQTSVTATISKTIVGATIFALEVSGMLTNGFDTSGNVGGLTSNTSTTFSTASLAQATAGELFFGVGLTDIPTGSPTLTGVSPGTLIGPILPSGLQVVSGGVYYLPGDSSAHSETFTSSGGTPSFSMTRAANFQPAATPPSPPTKFGRLSVAAYRAASFLVEKQPWKDCKSGLVIPGFADQRLLIAGT